VSLIGRLAVAVGMCKRGRGKNICSGDGQMPDATLCLEALPFA